jgi:general secretion pathway protein J
MTKPDLAVKNLLKNGEGFTLVEVLVVLSLLSLMMLAMGSALRTTAQTEERVDQRLQHADEMRVATDFLRSILGRVSARKKPGPVAVGASQYAFSGDENEITWIGIMPARYGAGGRYHFRLALEASPVGRALVVRFTPWVEDLESLDWSRSEAYTLVADVVEMALQYEDANVEPPVWASRWAEPDRLPQRVMMSLNTQHGTWPDLVIPMRIAPGSDPFSSGAVFGGTR